MHSDQRSNLVAIGDLTSVSYHFLSCVSNGDSEVMYKIPKLLLILILISIIILKSKLTINSINCGIALR